jgi:hypothetical protein
VFPSSPPHPTHPNPNREKEMLIEGEGGNSVDFEGLAGMGVLDRTNPPLPPPSPNTQTDRKGRRRCLLKVTAAAAIPLSSKGSPAWTGRWCPG